MTANAGGFDLGESSASSLDREIGRILGDAVGLVLECSCDLPKLGLFVGTQSRRGRQRDPGCGIAHFSSGSREPSCAASLSQIDVKFGREALHTQRFESPHHVRESLLVDRVRCRIGRGDWSLGERGGAR
jgi:hypothetical protein